MKRYYLSPIIGDGSEADAFRPSISAYDVNAIPWMPDEPRAGNMVMVEVITADHSALLADPAVDAMPNYPDDMPMLDMPAASLADINAVLVKHQLPEMAAIDIPYRAALVAINASLI